jgi:hypothetical protein
MKIILRAVELAVLGPFAVPVWMVRNARKANLEQI